MYKVFELLKNVYKIIDEQEDCLYLIEREDKAYLIDTGMSVEPLRPLIEQLSKKPVEVLLTHGHLDHAARSGEFEKVFIHPEDVELYHFFSSHQEGGPQMNYKESKDLLFFDEESLREDGFVLIPCAGHTPGSVLFADIQNQLLFTGDAVGSGCGMWLWDDISSTTSGLKKSLVKALGKLEETGVDDSWHFLGGHHNQEYMSKTGPYNPLNLQMFRDMVTLCEKLEANEVLETIEIDPSGLPHPKPGLKPFHVIYGKAEMLTAPEKIG